MDNQPGKFTEQESEVMTPRALSSYAAFSFVWDIFRGVISHSPGVQTVMKKGEVQSSGEF